MTRPPIHLENRTSIGVKKFSPTAARNKSAIFDALSPHLSKHLRVLEIAAGTGEHAHFMCSRRPDLTWQPTDPDAESRASQNAWREGVESQMAESKNLDVLKVDWDKNISGYDAVYCANMIHIAPLDALYGLAKGTSRLLRRGQILALYGPFLDGENSAPSNLEFSANLKSKNSLWGVRELDSVKHIFADVGFNEKARVNMPNNNRLLIFQKNS